MFLCPRFALPRALWVTESATSRRFIPICLAAAILGFGPTSLRIGNLRARKGSSGPKGPSGSRGWAGGGGRAYAWRLWLTPGDFNCSRRKAARAPKADGPRDAAHDLSGAASGSDVDGTPPSDDSAPSVAGDPAPPEAMHADAPADVGHEDIGPAIDAAGELAEIRAEWAWDNETSNFYVNTRGGQWLQATHGIAADYATGFSRQWAKPWCLQYGWQRQKGYKLETFGREGANKLAREWCRRADYFYCIWERSEEPNYVYTEDDVDGYPNNEELLSFMVAEGHESPAFQEGLAVRRLAPRLGPPPGP